MKLCRTAALLAVLATVACVGSLPTTQAAGQERASAAVLPPPAPITQAVAKLSGPERVGTAELVSLNSAGSSGVLAWASVNLQTGKYEIAQRPTGEQVLFFVTKVPGRYEFILFAASSDGKTIAIDQARHTVTVEGDAPVPPGPNPPVPPGPNPPGPLPDGKYGLAKFAHGAASALVTADPSKASTARNLAGSFSSVASMIAAGTVNGQADIKAKTTAANNTALGSARDAWLPFFNSLRVQLNDLTRQKKISANDDFATAWREIADGLNAVN
jgi:hypothetical protein